MRTALVGGAVALLAAGAMTGCSAPGTRTGDEATWTLHDADAVTAASRRLVVDVVRLGCASGRTGQVAATDVVYEPERIVITIDVDPIAEGNCLDNDVVTTEVDLAEPVGTRDLVDGTCLELGDDVLPCREPVRRVAP